MRLRIDDTDIEYTDLFIELTLQEIEHIEDHGVICFPWEEETEFSKKVYLTIKRDYMPLEKGKSKEVIGKNIKEMEESGHSKKQSVAASLNEARKSGANIPKKKK
jgi:hypothetical protein